MTTKIPMAEMAGKNSALGRNWTWRSLVRGVNGNVAFHSVKMRTCGTLVHGVNGHMDFHSVKMRRSCCRTGVLMLLIVAAGCNRGQTGTSELDSSEVNGQSTGVAVTTPGLLYLASEIAGEAVTVFLVGPGKEEVASWNPESSTISKLQKADLIIQNGAGYESWLQNITVPQGILIDATAISALELLPLSDWQTHKHGPTGQHSKTVYASHVWHDLAILRKQAILVRDQLIEVYPKHSDTFRAGCERVNGTLDELTRSIQKLTREHPPGPMVDPANSFAYLIRAFQSKPLPFDPNISPIDAASNPEAGSEALNELAARNPVVLLPIAGSYDSLQARLEQGHITVARLDTLEIQSSEQSFIDRFRENITRLTQAISARSP